MQPFTGTQSDDKAVDLSFDDRDSAPFAPLAMVADTAFTWGNDRPLGHSWHDTLIYEVHVKGFTKKLAGVPKRYRGTYAGVASEAAIRHLKELNVTTIELLPIHYRVDDQHLKQNGLSNYWGYNTLGFFAPDPRFATAPDRAVWEFKSMVRALHAAGIEVILDVVYNHTAEGESVWTDARPSVGSNNANYYFLSPEDPRYSYMDFTGCGNTPSDGASAGSATHHRQLTAIGCKRCMSMVSASISPRHLARESIDADTLGGFFSIVQQDPILS